MSVKKNNHMFFFICKLYSQFVFTLVNGSKTKQWIFGQVNQSLSL